MTTTPLSTILLSSRGRSPLTICQATGTRRRTPRRKHRGGGLAQAFILTRSMLPLAGSGSRSVQQLLPPPCHFYCQVQQHLHQQVDRQVHPPYRGTQDVQGGNELTAHQQLESSQEGVGRSDCFETTTRSSSLLSAASSPPIPLLRLSTPSLSTPSTHRCNGQQGI